MKILQNIADLIKVKTLVTFALVAVYAVLALRGTIEPPEVEKLTGIVVAFYFCTQADKRTATRKEG